MRAALLIILGFPLIAIAQSSPLEKRISVDLDQVTLEAALVKIGSLSATEFSYSDDIVPVGTYVSLLAENRRLEEILNMLLRPLHVEYKVAHGRIILRKAPAPVVQTVRGVVVDLSTHSPIPGVSIIIVDSNPLLGATSDADGKFKISHVPVGRTTIRVSSIGYDSKIISNILLGTGKELVLEIPIAESVTAMDEVVITATATGKELSSRGDIVSSREFSVEETKRYAGSFGDPARMASGYAGVTGASDESNALIVRGNSPRGVLWRVEGIEVPNPNHFATEGSSNGIVSVLSANMIDNSIFLTGAFPAGYGNALSAVFDMALRSGNNERAEHSIQAGLLGIEASTEGPFNARHTSSYLINYRYSTLDILDQLGVDLNAAGEFKNYQDVSFKVDVPFQQGKLSLFGIGGVSKSSRANNEVVNDDRSDLGVTGLTYQRAFDHTLLQASLSWSGTRITNDNEIRGLSGGVLKLEENYRKSYVRSVVQATHKFSDVFTLDGGLIFSKLFYDFYLRNLDPENQSYEEIVNFSEKNSTSIQQGFVSARHSFSPSLSAVYGFHFIHFGLTDDHSFEPRAAIRWKVNHRTALTAGYGKHSRIENLQYYLARDHQAGGDEVQINKNLGFTRADHFIVGYEHSIQRDSKLKIESYYQELYNAPVQSNPASVYASMNEDSGFITDTLINNGNGRNYGVEVSFEKSFSRNFYYLVNGSLFQSRFQIADGPERNTAYNGNYNYHVLIGKEFNVRSGRDVLGVNLKVTGAGGRRYIPIDLAASVEAGQVVYELDNAFEPSLPDYFRTDLQLVYRRNKPKFAVEWRIDIQNVTDHVNPAYYYYDDPSESIRLKNQVGFLPIVSYRIEF
ncbi:MAG TPA: TonB-dependent receptor [Ohtaekwangia sp.]